MSKGFVSIFILLRLRKKTFFTKNNLSKSGHVSIYVSFANKILLIFKIYPRRYVSLASQARLFVISHFYINPFQTVAYIGVNVIDCPSMTVLNRTDATNYITSTVKSEQKLHVL